MSNIINADNGVVSGIAGVKLSSDSTGVLDIQTNGTTAITISTAQVVSLTNSPTFTGGTANGVLYLNASKVATSGSALVFSGTQLAVTGSVSSSNSGNENYFLSDGLTRTSLQQNGNALYYNVNDNSATTGSFIWRNTNALSELMRLTSTGLGIGTTSPAYKLDVERSGDGITAGIAGGTYGIRFDNGGAFSSGMSTIHGVDSTLTASYQPIMLNGATVRFGISGTEVARFDSSGNLGIGTTSPSTRLTVSGTTTINTAASATAGLVVKTFDASGGSQPIANFQRSDAAINFQIGFDGTTGDTYAGTSTNHNLYFITNNTERARFNTTGAFVFAGGTTTANGIGITFPATQSASTNANTLDDYEEGTFTPTVITATGTPTYDYQVAYYTKIGRQVFGGGIIGISNSNSLTGPIRLGGLPFTIAAGLYGYAGGAVSDGSGFTFPVVNGFYSIYLQASNSNNYFEYVGVGVTAAPVNYNSVGIGSSWYFRFTFSYYV